MKISKNLIDLGINEGIIEFVHSRTRNKDWEIVLVELANKHTKPNISKPIEIRLTLNRDYHKHFLYSIDLAKVRQKRINIILKS